MYRIVIGILNLMVAGALLGKTSFFGYPNGGRGIDIFLIIFNILIGAFIVSLGVSDLKEEGYGRARRD